MDTDLEDTGRRDVRPNFETVDLVNLPPGSLPPLRNAHVPSVLRSLTESSESASLPSAETYLSIFISSKQAQQYSSIPKYICNLLCVILLMTKLSRNSRYITWFLVILPLFISNTISFCEKLSEVHFILVTQEQDEFSLSRAFRPIASIIDILGSFYTKLVLCTYLSYGYSISLNEISLLIPLWITFGLASLLRFTAKDLTSESNRSVRSTSTQTRLVLLFGLTFLFLQRVAQPLLILLKLGDKLSERTHWSIVFGPSWVTLFFVLACSLLLISFAPLISSHGNQTLRDVTKILIYLLASRLAVGAICSIIFLVLLSERLDYYESSNIHGSDVSINRILLPLVVFFLFLLVIQPLVMQTTVKYQETLAAMVLQRQNRPGSSASSDSSSSTSVIVEKNKRNMYFLQISPTLYALCDAHGNSITLQPTKSVPQKIKELYNTFFPVKRKPRKNAVTSNSQTYSEIQQSHHTNQAIELSTFSSSISIAEDSHGSYLEEEGNEDAEEESCVILHSKELEQEIQLILRGMEEQNVETVSPKLSSGSSFQYTQCVVCLNNIANGIIYDCGHAVTCLACGISIARKPPGHCPICRATITSLLEMSTKPFPLDTQKVMTISRCGYTFHTNHPLASTGHSTHHSMLSMPHRQLLPTNGHMITNTISNFAANQSLNTQQDSILDILMN